MYEIQEAKELVIEAGHKLLEEKLIARTWGNISARISESEFVITPSGRAYDSLKPEDLVVVKISDCSYSGDIKPSSEKGIHAAAYELRPGVNFIIHTHQHYASAVCAEEEDTPFAPCVKYALSGTKQLKDNVMFSLAIHPEYKAFLLAKHGTLCLGESPEDAFNIANKLEDDCHKLFVEKSIKCKESKYKKIWLDDYAQFVGARGVKQKFDDPQAAAMIIAKNRAAAEYVTNAKPLGFFDSNIQRAVYVFKYSKLKQKNR